MKIKDSYNDFLNALIMCDIFIIISSMILSPYFIGLENNILNTPLQLKGFRPKLKSFLVFLLPILVLSKLLK
jgi:hypothetical protein